LLPLTPKRAPNWPKKWVWAVDDVAEAGRKKLLTYFSAKPGLVPGFVFIDLFNIEAIRTCASDSRK
jgi:hypothetical protein